MSKDLADQIIKVLLSHGKSSVQLCLKDYTVSVERIKGATYAVARRGRIRPIVCNQILLTQDQLDRVRHLLRVS